MNKRITVWLLFSLIGFLKAQRVIVRLQGSDLIDWRQKYRWKYRFAAICLRLASGLVCVNKPLFDAAVKLGVPSERVLLMPGFLPPAPEELDPGQIDSATNEFMSTHSPLIVANGKIAWHSGQDLYGIDMIVSLVARLHADYPNVAAIICLAAPAQQDRAYLDELKSEALAQGVGGRILFRTEAGFFLPILSRATIFVRPTNTEGDSNSVREALGLGIPTIASDVAPRPPGTVLFRNRDAEELFSQTRTLLAKCSDSLQDRGELHLPPNESSQEIDRYVKFLLGQPT